MADVGRPTVMTEDTLQKLRDGFLRGYSDDKACLFADIAPSTLYNYQKQNPEFIDQKEQLKKNQLIKAKNVVVDALDKKDREMAKWYLERKSKNEFSQRNEISGENGQPILFEIIRGNGFIPKNTVSTGGETTQIPENSNVGGSDTVQDVGVAQKG